MQQQVNCHQQVQPQVQLFCQCTERAQLIANNLTIIILALHKHGHKSALYNLYCFFVYCVSIVPSGIQSDLSTRHPSTSPIQAPTPNPSTDPIEAATTYGIMVTVTLTDDNNASLLTLKSTTMEILKGTINSTCIENITTSKNTTDNYIVLTATINVCDEKAESALLEDVFQDKFQQRIQAKFGNEAEVQYTPLATDAEDSNIGAVEPYEAFAIATTDPNASDSQSQLIDDTLQLLLDILIPLLTCCIGVAIGILLHRYVIQSRDRVRKLLAKNSNEDRQNGMLSSQSGSDDSQFLTKPTPTPMKPHSSIADDQKAITKGDNITPSGKYTPGPKQNKKKRKRRSRPKPPKPARKQTKPYIGTNVSGPPTPGEADNVEDDEHVVPLGERDLDVIHENVATTAMNPNITIASFEIIDPEDQQLDYKFGKDTKGGSSCGSLNLPGPDDKL